MDFRLALNTVKYRLAKAKTKGGLDETKLELNRPFDSTDGRLEP